MMEKEEQLSALQLFRGTPNNPDKEGEKNRWKRFIEWLRPRWAITQAGLAAKARQEIAKARILEQQAEQEAMKTIEMYARMEQQNAKEVEFEILSNEQVSENELQQEWETLEEKIKLFELRYCGRIRIK